MTHYPAISEVRSLSLDALVRVRLTDWGRRWYALNHRFKPDLYVPPKEDADGWSLWSLRQLMQDFGNCMYDGMKEPPFLPDMEIE